MIDAKLIQHGGVQIVNRYGFVHGLEAELQGICIQSRAGQYDKGSIGRCLGPGLDNIAPGARATDYLPLLADRRGGDGGIHARV